MTPTDPLSPQSREKWVGFIQGLHPDIDPAAVRLMDEMRLVSHLIYQLGENSLAESGLSYAQYRVLLSLLFCEQTGRSDGLNPSEISDRQGVSRNTVSALIRNLEDDGLIERHLDREDRRKFNIYLTETGRRLVLAHASRHMQTVGAIFHELDKTEMETLSSLLNKLNHRAIALKGQCYPATSGGSHATGR